MKIKLIIISLICTCFFFGCSSVDPVSNATESNSTGNEPDSIINMNSTAIDWTDSIAKKPRIPECIAQPEGDVEILVAEGTARSNDDPEAASSVWDNSGYQDLLTDSHLTGINFRLLNINQTFNDLEAVNLGNLGTAAPHNKTYYVHNEELDADVYISVPVLKIHDTGITNALKNQIGTELS